MFKGTDKSSKVVIAVLFVLLAAQSVGVYMLRNQPPQILEVEAEVCHVDNVVCARSDDLTEMLGASDTLYLCMEGTP